MKQQIWDMHIHLDFFQNAQNAADDAKLLKLGMFAVTVTPQGFKNLKANLRNAENVVIGVGLHPWWAADGRCGMGDGEMAAELIQGTRYVGEIGLDASQKHVPEGSLEKQVEIFETICRACSGSDIPEEKRILSIHSVKAGTLTLDILERTGCLDKCCCIFHWFTGSSDELNRAVRSGCMFSVNEMMLRTRRGREYVRQLPADRLLLETDLPPGQNVIYPAENILLSLNNTLSELQLIRGLDMSRIMGENSERILMEYKNSNSI